MKISIVVVVAATGLALTACSTTAGMSPAEQRAQTEWDTLPKAEQDLACLLFEDVADQYDAWSESEEAQVLSQFTDGEGLFSEEDEAYVTILRRNC